ncbi:hypothetical protein N5F23_11255 [Pseudomonas sichuanensis]|uniref:hypothetical protein n=1 Tax=Pseudomonas sichuanensis TaxID=2213015 RepID=UPI0024483E92|nr:hypothetical protein [Pseudomonas sichuanensis]MDH0729407.1 hypothetical protein [Pseudomonas sichuanensis]MDH1583174.1 hypothetical protein [Pseudomonas sichuanensis]MDH1590744.1 hypothetical protein [Pseudomonas sichuanensis]MDH1596059.1 hypothetical protein [Pseudomonas sichuanensis]
MGLFTVSGATQFSLWERRCAAPTKTGISCSSGMNATQADDECANVPVVSRQGQTDIPAAINEFYE